MENTNIKESVKILLENKNHSEIVRKFAIEKYREKFKDMKRNVGTFHAYDGYQILSENEIKINYIFGAGDIEYNDSFKIQL
jgi:hypothetical protein